VRCTLVIVSLVLLVGTFQVQSVYPHHGNVIPLIECFMFDGNGENFSTTLGIAEYRIEENMFIFECSAKVPNDTGKTVMYDGHHNPSGGSTNCIYKESGTYDKARTTFDWSEIITIKGDAVITCKFDN